MAEQIDTDATALLSPLEGLEPTSAADVQQAVMDALVAGSGYVLGASLNSWLGNGEPSVNHQVLMGPAGTVCIVAVSVQTLPAHRLGEVGRA